jgi:membrane protein DedA with SNARE-associated domain
LVLFEFLTGFITDLICTFGYPGIVFLMTLESACLPVPSEIVLPFAGFAAQQGRLEFFSTGSTWAFIVAGLAGAIGCLIGSVLSYVVGYYGGRPLLEKYGRYILITPHEIEMAHKWFERYGVATVFIARLLPIVRTFVSLPAGIARMDFKKFAIYSFVGSVPWCLALAYAGVVLGENWETLESYWIYFDILTVIGVIAFILYVGYKITRGHSGQRA